MSLNGHAIVAENVVLIDLTGKVRLEIAATTSSTDSAKQDGRFVLLRGKATLPVSFHIYCRLSLTFGKSMLDLLCVTASNSNHSRLIALP